jgi:hypothetical protein
MKGRECSEASWDAQAYLERAINVGEEGVVALLDYDKFFDSFEPRFFAKLLSAMGVHHHLVSLFIDLNTKARRRKKIGDTFGPEFTPFNALG